MRKRSWILVAVFLGMGCPAPERQPPAGFSMAREAPAGVSNLWSFGTHLSLALDAEGAPMLAYVWEDENGDTNREDTRVYFTRWLVDEQRWSEPVRVAELGQIDSNNPLRQLSLSRDARTGRLGIAHVKGYYEIGLALSEDGVSWSSGVVQPQVRSDTVANPALALHDGTIHLAYYKNYERCTAGSCDAIVYRKGTAASDLSRETVPLVTGTGANPAMPVGLAVDSEGQAALAYFLSAGTDVAPQRNNVTLAFWRPGSPAVKVIDSADRQNDAPSVSLAFFGNKPRLAYHLGRPEDIGASNLTASPLRFSASEDGIQWAEAVRLPQDGQDTTLWYQSLAIAADGSVAVVANFNGSLSTAPGQCGGPKVFRSSDLRNFTACGADPTENWYGGRHVQAAIGPDGKLMVVFQNEDSSRPVAAGIVFWREE